MIAIEALGALATLHIGMPRENVVFQFQLEDVGSRTGGPGRATHCFGRPASHEESQGVPRIGGCRRLGLILPEQAGSKKEGGKTEVLHDSSPDIGAGKYYHSTLRSCGSESRPHMGG